MSSSPKIFFMGRVGSFKMADVICQIGRLAVENRTMAVLILYLLSSKRQMTVFYWGLLGMYLLRHIFLNPCESNALGQYIRSEQEGSKTSWILYRFSTKTFSDLRKCKCVSLFAINPVDRRIFKFLLGTPTTCNMHFALATL